MDDKFRKQIRDVILALRALDYSDSYILNVLLGPSAESPRPAANSVPSQPRATPGPKPPLAAKPAAPRPPAPAAAESSGSPTEVAPPTKTGKSSSAGRGVDTFSVPTKQGTKEVTITNRELGTFRRDTGHAGATKKDVAAAKVDPKRLWTLGRAMARLLRKSA